MKIKLLKNLLILSLCFMVVFTQFESLTEEDEEIVNGEEYVQTPFGLLPRECVLRVPTGTHIQETEEGFIHLTNDQENFVKRVARNEKCDRKNPTKLLKTWIDNGGWTIPDGLTLQKFEGNYKVPNDPQLKSNQILYYFIGSQNNDGSGPGISIIQPVLTFRYNKWFFQSWNCCPQGMAINSSPVGNVKAGDTLYGSVEIVDDKVTIVSQNSEGQSSTLSVSREDRNFNWIDATLEVYKIISCKNFPTEYLEYSNMNVTLSNGQSVQPQWEDQYGNSMCNGRTSIIDNQTIRIQHNIQQTQQN
ncbi:hypothetical protein TTHERM_00129970 (macronuclear) [Tetrahymena thermophila SB210]|uniref:Transmembrane protein n=1 Tax=Tetrahymena thermophila (strain SB210) TaxID=312017 RepID=I7M7Y1_TETTS|nr:hypothetical protein TTHERM_00129970 [Tetrahymena thermophila SB210]EAR96220.2 hypothetical protein TTHERM_00129970 [Tetrahymena thermophila SB210]|eukprot:XP_001016465.2 hypothetical protein TTHERM_00129970 [Tetrahymena thermophila SB210]